MTITSKYLYYAIQTTRDYKFITIRPIGFPHHGSTQPFNTHTKHTQVHNTNKNHTKIKRKPNKQKHKQALGTFKSLHLDTSAQPINTGANQGQTPVHPSLFSMLTAAADQGERNYMARTSPGTDFPTQSDTLLSQR